MVVHENYTCTTSYRAKPRGLHGDIRTLVQRTARWEEDTSFSRINDSSATGDVVLLTRKVSQSCTLSEDPVTPTTSLQTHPPPLHGGGATRSIESCRPKPEGPAGHTLYPQLARLDSGSPLGKPERTFSNTVFILARVLHFATAASTAISR